MKVLTIAFLGCIMLFTCSCSETDADLVVPSNLPQEENQATSKDGENSNRSDSFLTCEESIAIEMLDCGPDAIGSIQYKITNCYRGRRPSGVGGILVRTDTVTTTIPCHKVEYPEYM